MRNVFRLGSSVSLVVAGAVVATLFNAPSLTTQAQTATATPAKAPAAPALPDELKGKTIIASGLRQPRQLQYAADGTLYIAESGVGGDVALTSIATRTVQAGLSSRISMVGPDGKWGIAQEGLPSTANGGAPNFNGAYGVHVTDDSFWVTIGYGPDQKGMAFTLFHNVMQIDRKTHRMKRMVDTWAGAVTEKAPSPEGMASNPVDIAVAKDGTVLIADASANILWAWTEKGGLKIAAKWALKDDNPVPTSVAVGPDGDIYVGMLTGFPFPVGKARIERWSAGKLKQTYGGLTMVTDVLVTKEGDIYATQYAEFGDRGPKPLSGKVLKVKADGKGADTVMEGLPLPYGLAQNPKDGSIVVSVFSSGDKDGKGAVIKVK